MNTTTITGQATHRKLIDIPEDVFRALSLKAASLGLNLKKYIEHLLEEEANEMDEAEIYRYLVASRPQGKVMLEGQEKEDFMRRNGIGSHR